MQETGKFANFAPFTLDLGTGELRRDGRPVKLHPQPVQVLTLLVDRPGELVTREELQKELWDDDTFVDFDLGINSCVRQIRTALGDDADKPRFIETVPRKGYRFVAPLEEPALEQQGDRSVSPSPPDGSMKWRRSRAVWWMMASLVGMVAVVAIWGLMREAPAPPTFLTHFVVNIPPDQRLEIGPAPPLALSADGTRLVYVARHAGRSQLYFRNADEFEARALPGTEEAESPFFSPNGEWVGFFAESKLKKVALSGGTPSFICDASWGNPAGYWGPDDTIIFGTPNTVGLATVSASASGGEPQPLTTPDVESGERRHLSPQILPDGSILFTIVTKDGTRVGLLTPESENWRVLDQLGEARSAVFVPPGYLVYARSGGLMAVGFDPATKELADSSVPVLDGLYSEMFGGVEVPYFAVSHTGSLVYVPSSNTVVPKELVWVDRNGTATLLGRARANYRRPRILPNGQVVVAGIEESGIDIWIFDPERDTRKRLTSDGMSHHPAPRPDGAGIVFSSSRNGSVNLYWKPFDGSVEPELLLDRPGAQFTWFWTSDSRYLVFGEDHPENGWDILMLDLQEDGSPSVILQTSFDERDARLSPDGRWMAFSSNESGRRQVFVRPFPGPGTAPRISTELGLEPVWSANGRELFYRADSRMMVVDVVTEPDFQFGTPRLLFEDPYDMHPGRSLNYDVTRDGEHFVMVRRPPEAEPSQINVVLNWNQELARLVPSGN